MRYISVAQIVARAGKSRSAVTRALKLAGVKTERFPGVKGLRLSMADANRFLGKQWPDAQPFQS